ncbi:hypothetical protein [Streptomyces sp. DH12]|uniref:hypothetical protein n=1 Tax=Streptomyces sp. DH12 TaxID=2857010 RepID=UPI001E57D186|nr:hypothetical protein [Streptomyces sp. DH12]
MWSTDSAGLRLLRGALFVPGWHLAPGDDPFLRAYAWLGGLTLAGLVAGILLLVPRLVGRTPAGGARWAASVGAGVLVAAVSSALAWLAVETVEPGILLAFGESTSFGAVLVDGVLFGLVLGVLLAVGYRAAGTAPGTAPRTASRNRERRSAVADSPDERPVAVATGTSPGDVTRYLCAAAYTDPDFADRVVEDVLGDGLGAVAASPGVDLVPVARHSLTAGRLRRGRDRRLAAAFGLVAVSAPLWLLFARLALGALASASRTRRRAVRGRELPPTSAATWRLAGTAGGLLVTGVLLGAALSAASLPGPLAWLAGGYLLGIPALLAVVACCALTVRTVVAEEADVDARLRGALRRDAFDPEGLPRPGHLEPWAAARIAAVSDAQRGNVSCYSGHSPFVGYGRRDGEWTLSVPLLPADAGPERRSGPVTGFDAWDLVERLRHRLRGAAEEPGTPLPDHGEGRGAGRGVAGHEGQDRRGAEGQGEQGAGGRDGARRAPGAEGPIAGLVVEDRVFVSGREAVRDRRLLPDPLRPPATRLPPETLRWIARHPDGAARHFLTSHVPLWGGEIVPTHFLHVAVEGRTLHLRCERFVLGPVRRDMHLVDLLPPGAPSARRRRSLALRALRRSGSALWAAPRSCLSDALADRRRRVRRRHETRAACDDPAYDRGARISVRDLAQGPEYFHHFQLVDALRTLNALDRHALAAVRDFLDDHGVDTADFRTQTQTILNNGVLQTGGVSVVGNQAVGTGAQATAESSTARPGGPPPPGPAARRQERA